jgi:hypothetical protein
MPSEEGSLDNPNLALHSELPAYVIHLRLHRDT